MEKKTKKTKIIDILFIIVVVMCFCVTSLLLYRNICYDKVIVSGKSMEPTLLNGDYGLMKTTSGAKKSIKRFDIVIFKVDETDTSEGHDIIKRIIGMPGEHVEIKDGKVYINGGALAEDYLPEGMTTESLGGVFTDLVVPEGCIFVLGDNREISLDSRYDKVGLVDVSDVEGKVFVRLYPFNDISFIN